MAVRGKGISYFFCTLALVLGLVIGWFGGEYLCKNDTFELLGEKEYSINANEVGFEYFDEGVKIIEFGRDISGKVTVETNMLRSDNGAYAVDTTVPGKYYIKYTVDSYRYGEIARIRVFTVGGGAD